MIYLAHKMRLKYILNIAFTISLLLTTIQNELVGQVTSVSKIRLPNTYSFNSGIMVSPDGKTIMFSYSNNEQSDIAVFEKNELDQWKEKPVSKKINSRFNEKIYYLSNDGNEIIFSRDSVQIKYFITKRIGNFWTMPKDTAIFSFKGFSIHSFTISNDKKKIIVSAQAPNQVNYNLYVGYRGKNESWSKLTKLGTEINSSKDELFPSLHPNGKTLHYSSNRNGNNDIYKSQKKDGAWREATLLDEKINTTSSESSIAVLASGKAGYFTRNNNTETEIYEALFPEENIPITLIKGKVISVDGYIPEDIKIMVYDSETQENLKYIYSPQAKTGNYLMIFPPGKMYTMIVEAEGYEPYSLPVGIPDQSYYYQLQQTIILNKKQEIDNKSGIVIQNNFDQDVFTNDNKEKNLLNLIEKIINDEDTTALANLDTYIRAKSQKNKTYANLLSVVEQVIELGDFEMLKNLESISSANNLKKADLIIYFASNSSLLTSQDKNKLKNLCQQVSQANQVVISGHSDVQGSNLSKYLISSIRANTVADYFSEECKLDKSKIKIVSLGDAQLLSKYNPNKNRRVEIEISK